MIQKIDLILNSLYEKMLHSQMYWLIFTRTDINKVKYSLFSM